MSADVIGNIIQQKRKTEADFVAAVFANPEIAYRSYSHFSAAAFSDESARSFWDEFLRNGGDATRAAISVGVLGRLATSVGDLPVAGRLDIYAERFERVVLAYRIAEQLGNMLTDCERGEIESAIERLDALGNRRGEWLANRSGKDAHEVAKDFETNLRGGFDALPTGIEKLDRALGRIGRRLLTVVASRPSVGKTAFALEIARFTATQPGRKVLYFSTESSATELWGRMAAGEAGIDWRTIVSQTAPPADIDAVIQASQAMARRYDKRLIVDEESRTLLSIHSVIASHLPDMVVIDHLDEITQEQTTNRVQWLGYACSYIKNLAKRYNCAMILVHQLSRAVEGRDDHIPVLSDLRGSGDLEAKADTVLMPYRKDIYDLALRAEKVPFDVWIRKNRFAVRDVEVTLEYNLKRQKIYAPLYT